MDEKTTTENSNASDAVDEEALSSYVASLSPDECHALYDLLREKYEGGDEVYSMEQIAAGK